MCECLARTCRRGNSHLARGRRTRLCTALQRRWPRDRRRDQEWGCLLPGRRPRGERAGAECGSRPQGGQDLGRAVSAPPDRDEFRARPARRPGAAAAHRARRRAVPAALPAQDHAAHRQDCQRGGPAALARPGKRTDFAGGLPAVAGIRRPDGGDRRLGAQTSGIRLSRLALQGPAADQSGRQYLSSGAATTQYCGRNSRGHRRSGGRSGLGDRHRDHRGGAVRRLLLLRSRAQAAARRRHPHCNRRLRYGFLLARPPVRAAHRHSQDRPPVHQSSARGSPQLHPGLDDHRSGACVRHDDRRGRRRDPDAVGLSGARRLR